MKEDHFEEEEISSDPIGEMMFRMGMFPDMTHFRGATFYPQVEISPEVHMDSMNQIMETMTEAYESPYKSSQQEKQEEIVDMEKTDKMKEEETKMTDKMKEKETKKIDKMEEEATTEKVDEMETEDMEMKTQMMKGIMTGMDQEGQTEVHQ